MPQWTTAEWDEKSWMYWNEECLDVYVEPDVTSAPSSTAFFWCVKGAAPRFEWPDIINCGHAATLEEAQALAEKCVANHPWHNQHKNCKWVTMGGFYIHDRDCPGYQSH